MNIQDLEARINHSKTQYNFDNVSLPFAAKVFNRDVVVWFFFTNKSNDALLFTITKCFVYDGYHVRCWDCNIDDAIINCDDNRDLMTYDEYMQDFCAHFEQKEKFDMLELLTRAEPLSIICLYKNILKHFRQVPELLINYSMTLEERREANYVAGIVNQEKPQRFLAVGDCLQPDCFGAIKCIKQGSTFDYYLLTIDNMGKTVVCNVNHSIAHLAGASRDKAIFVLLSRYCFGQTLQSREYHLYEGLAIKTCFDVAAGAYSLHLLADQGILQKRAELAISNGDAVFRRVQCDCGLSLVAKIDNKTVRCYDCNKLFDIHP